MSLAYLVGFLCIAVATSPGLIIVGRFCGGVGLGLTLSVTPVYLVEVTTITSRGMLGVVPPLFTQVSIISHLADLLTLIIMLDRSDAHLHLWLLPGLADVVTLRCLPGLPVPALCLPHT